MNLDSLVDLEAFTCWKEHLIIDITINVINELNTIGTKSSPN